MDTSDNDSHRAVCRATLASAVPIKVTYVQECRPQIFTAWLAQAAEPSVSPTALRHTCLQTPAECTVGRSSDPLALPTTSPAPRSAVLPFLRCLLGAEVLLSAPQRPAGDSRWWLGSSSTRSRAASGLAGSAAAGKVSCGYSPAQGWKLSQLSSSPCLLTSWCARPLQPSLLH